MIVNFLDKLIGDYSDNSKTNKMENKFIVLSLSFIAIIFSPILGIFGYDNIVFNSIEELYKIINPFTALGFITGLFFAYTITKGFQTLVKVFYFLLYVFFIVWTLDFLIYKYENPMIYMYIIHLIIWIYCFVTWLRRYRLLRDKEKNVNIQCLQRYVD